jgi:hypothetical protein
LRFLSSHSSRGRATRSNLWFESTFLSFSFLILRLQNEERRAQKKRANHEITTEGTQRSTASREERGVRERKGWEKRRDFDSSELLTQTEIAITNTILESSYGRKQNRDGEERKGTGEGKWREGGRAQQDRAV